VVHKGVGGKSHSEAAADESLHPAIRFGGRALGWNTAARRNGRGVNASEQLRVVFFELENTEESTAKVFSRPENVDGSRKSFSDSRTSSDRAR
jgi:hypothetical protein